MSDTSWKGYETIRVSHFRSGILNIDGNQYEIIFNDDGQFQDVYNKNRQYRFMKKIAEGTE